jgi:hypothetical protein
LKEDDETGRLQDVLAAPFQITARRCRHGVHRTG